MAKYLYWHNGDTLLSSRMKYTLRELWSGFKTHILKEEGYSRFKKVSHIKPKEGWLTQGWLIILLIHVKSDIIKSLLHLFIFPLIFLVILAIKQLSQGG